MKNMKFFGVLISVLAIIAFATTSVSAKNHSRLPSVFSLQKGDCSCPLTDEALAAAAEVLGITADELSAALEAGTTLEELAETAGVEVSTVYDAIKEVMPEFMFRFGIPGKMIWNAEALAAAAEVLGITTDELSAALEEGTTLEELAETAGVEASAVFDAIKEVMPGFRKEFGIPGEMLWNAEALAAAAEVLGITTDELSAALEEGTTLEELAETAGVEVSDVFDAIQSTMPEPEEPGLTDEALAAAAEVLGVTTDELSAALEEGTTLEELAETAGVEVSDVLDAIREISPIPAAPHENTQMNDSAPQNNPLHQNQSEPPNQNLGPQPGQNFGGQPGQNPGSQPNQGGQPNRGVQIRGGQL